MAHTVVGPTWYTSTTLTIDITHVLFETRVGDAAGSCWNRAARILRTWDGCDKRKERDNGGDGELHVDWIFVRWN